MANRFAAVIKGLIFGVIFLMIWQITKINLGIWGIVIFFAIILLTILLSASSTPTPSTPAVPILKRINWTAAGIVLAAVLLYGALVFLGLTKIAETEQRAEMNAFRPESLSGVTIIKQGNNFLIAEGEKDGGNVTLVSEEINPCIQFNYSGGNSTFEVNVGGIFYGGTYNFSNPTGVFSTCNHKGEYNNSKKQRVEIEIVVEKDDTIKITNYRVWKEY